MDRVSEPASGSATEKACSRMLPSAIAGQIGLLLLDAAVPQDRAHHVHLRVTGRRVPTGTVDLLHDHARLADAEPEAAVLGRDQRREVPGVGERVDELLRVGPLPVQPPPVLVRKPGAQPADLGAKLVMRLRMIHLDSSGVRFVHRHRSCTVAAGDSGGRAVAEAGWLREVTALRSRSGGLRWVASRCSMRPGRTTRPPAPARSPQIRIRCTRPPRPARRRRTGGPSSRPRTRPAARTTGNPPSAG
jgi:hypothetical protein